MRKAMRPAHCQLFLLRLQGLLHALLGFDAGVLGVAFALLGFALGDRTRPLVAERRHLPALERRLLFFRMYDHV